MELLRQVLLKIAYKDSIQINLSCEKYCVEFYIIASKHDNLLFV